MTLAPIRFDDVTIAYDRHPAVHHVSGSFDPGSLTAITGPNGAGKSTLLKALVGELPLAEGSIDRGGLTIQDFGYLPQAADIDRRFPITVADTVMLGAWRETGAFGGSTRRPPPRRDKRSWRSDWRDLSVAILVRFPPANSSACSSPGSYSKTPRSSFWTNPLRQSTRAPRATSWRSLRTWHHDGRTVIAVLHDFDLVRANFPQTLLLAREAIDWGATEVALSPTNLLRTRAVAENWNENAPVCEPEKRIGL